MKSPKALFEGAVRVDVGASAKSSAVVESTVRTPDRFTRPFMVETNGGGSWEDVSGFDAYRARNVGLPDFIGTPGPSHPVAESTIETDTKVPIGDTTSIPWRSICRLDILYKHGRSGVGTAWFVGPCALATAAHNLLHEKAGPAQNLVASPAYDGVVRYNSPEVEQFVYPKEWAETFKPKFDYAVILLKDPGLGNQLGWFGIAGYDSPPENLPAQVCGYAKGTPRPTQYFSGGRVKSWSDDFLDYTFDTAPGMSGSPVFTKINEERYAIGIHAYGHDTYNQGRRLSGAAFKMLQDASGYKRA
jgi:V8-like Glu-specific endopeptidase